MGWSYRKAISLGPFRMNVSKSGVGYSVGGQGFRTGIRANGRRYTRVSIPGTGLYHATTHPQSPTKGAGGCALVVAIGGLGALSWTFL